MAALLTVGQRFSQLIQVLGMSKNAFALSLDKTATVIQHIVEERNKPGFDLLCKVFEVYPNVSKDWLMQGSGAMFSFGQEASAAAAVPTISPVTVPAPESVEAPATAPIQPVQPVQAAHEIVAAPVPTAQPVAMPVAPEMPAAAPAVAAPATQPMVAAAPMPAPAPIPPVAEAFVAPVAAVAPAPAPNWEAMLYAQQLQHQYQLALEQQRNQHLLEQQKLLLEQQKMMQQMMELLRR